MTFSELNLAEFLRPLSSSFHPVIKLKPEAEKIILINFSHKNKELEKIDFENTAELSNYMKQLLATKSESEDSEKAKLYRKRVAVWENEGGHLAANASSSG